MNQTNIGANNNKFYRIQVLQNGNNYYAWNRWGRVGESGQSKLFGPKSKAEAIKDFEKKFSDKTKNKWENRDNFEAKTKKYTLLEMEYSDDENETKSDSEEEDSDIEETQSKRKSKSKTKSKGTKKKECKLPKRLQGFLNLIFDEDMFADSMKELKLDTRKMPLGKISKSQIDKGFAVLEELQDVVEVWLFAIYILFLVTKSLNFSGTTRLFLLLCVLKMNKKGKSSKKSRDKINELSSRFYTLIPHDFGRSKPPPIDTADDVQEKMDMLEVLTDIESAQEVIGKQKGSKEDEMHPLDLKYSKLGAELAPLDKKSKEYKLITTYFNNTNSGSYWRSNAKIVDIFSCLQPSQLSRYEKNGFSELENKKLLWHGTNVAVVVAILKSGLRIMPHSGGRVGKGMRLCFFFNFYFLNVQIICLHRNLFCCRECEIIRILSFQQQR